MLDSMLEDKNEEIDHLKEQLLKKEKQLEIFLALNLDESQIKELARQSEPKNSARTLSDILSINSEYEEFPEAIREAVNLTQGVAYNVSNLKTPSEVSQGAKSVVFVSPLLTIEPNKTGVDVPRLELNSQSDNNGVVNNSKTLESESKSSSTIGEEEIKSRNVIESELNDENLLSKDEQSSFETRELSREFINEECPRHGKNSPIKSANKKSDIELETLRNQLDKVRDELRVKCEKLSEREAELNSMQRDLLELRNELKETIDTLTWDKFFYKEQFELAQASESKIKKDLVEVENNLKARIEEGEELRSKIQLSEKIAVELKKENSRMREDVDERVKKQLELIDATLKEKSQELKNLKEIIFEKDITIETLSTRNVEIENENKQLYEFKTKFEACRQELVNSQEEIQRLTEGLNNRDLLIRRLEEMARRSSLSGASSPSENKDQEIHHLQEHLKEKDKVIRQMSDDSKSLQKALETIQNKMRESGNVVELRRKLKEEKKLNAELKEMVEKLHEEIENSRR